MDKTPMNPSGNQLNDQDSASRVATAQPAGRSVGAWVFTSPLGPRIMLAPPDEGGAGGAGAGGEGGDAGAGEGAGGDGGTGGGEGGGSDQKPVRPDYIPESFWDTDKGFKSDDFNSLVAFKAEHDANLAQVPPDKDGYEVKLPEDFKLPEGFQLPEGQESVIDANDPRIAFARDFAHANQFSQAQFESLVALGAQMDVAEQESIKEALGKQREQLGGKANERINAVTTWLGAKIGGELAGALAPMMFTAKQINAFEALMRANRGVLPGGPGGGRDPGKTEISDEEYNKMSPAEKINYARQHSRK